jgi:hypothetical protein
MRHHPIASEIPCPYCGRPGLVFEHAIPMGDKYLCSGCKHASIHVSIGRRGKGCCLRTIVSGANLGPLRPCGSQEGKVSPDE